MNELLCGCIGFALLAVAALECKAQELREVSPAECMHRADDYSFMWWAHGLRDSRRVRCYQTGRFGLAVDTEKVQILHLGTINNAASAEEVLTQSNEVIFALPPADLDLGIIISRVKYRCVRSVAENPRIHGARLVESGYFLQRGDIWGLEFQNDDGELLYMDGRFEVAVWPDHLGFKLQVWPEGEDWENVELIISLKSMGQTFSSTEKYNKLELGRKAQASIAMQPLPDGSGWQESGSWLDANISVTTGDQTCPVEYDPTLGWFRIDTNNARSEDFNRDSLERIKVRLSNPESKEKTFRLMFDKYDRGLHGTGEISPITGLSPILCDIEGRPLGIPIQISKNWHSADIPIPYQGLWFHGLTMLNVPPESQVEFELRVAYAQWGGVAAASHAQLCLIGWGNNQLWNEAAIGSWGETLCFEPDQGQVGGSVLDTRPLMVHSMNKDKPTKWSWTNNVGGADFLVYYDMENKKQWHSRMRTLYQRYCPNLTEVTYAGRTHDSKVDLQYTVSLYRCDDIARGVYRFRYDVREPVDFSRFVLFQCGGDDYSYTGERKFAIGNEKGLIKEWDTQWGGNKYKTDPVELSGSIPWLSMHEAVSRDESAAGAWANRGVIIRKWKARLGGKSANPWIAERGAYMRGADTSLFDILPPANIKQLQPGDFVEAEVVHVVMPQFAEDYYGPNENLRAALQEDENTWRMIYREAICNDLTVIAYSGNVLREYPILIEVGKKQFAHFSVSSGIGYIPMTFTGLEDYKDWELIQLNGKERVIDQSIHGNDFWQTDYNPVTRQWSITYNVSLDTPDDQINIVEFIFRRKK